MSHPGADHCIRVARHGCGCKHCIAWRKALAEWRATGTEQQTLPMEGTR
jgi:hypothetical protein